MDTGAKYTCCYYRAVNQTLKEEQFYKCEYKNLCGIVNGVAVRFYKHHLKQFTIGSIGWGRRRSGSLLMKELQTLYWEWIS